jgi:nucleotide-binding universal stress UspA family protein
MLDIKRILCPIDFSDAPRHAMDHAVAFAEWSGSHITALYVSDPVLLPNPPILFAELPGGFLPSEADRQSFDDRLREWLVPANAAGLHTDALLDEGLPAGLHSRTRDLASGGSD